MTVALALLAGCGGGGDGTASSADHEGKVAFSTSSKLTQTLAAPSQSQWSQPIPLSLVPAAAANLPDGKLLLWSAQGRFAFNSVPGNTYTAVFDPATGTSVERLVTENNHNMFCPGTANLPDGRLLVSGGSSSAATSIYDPALGTWSSAAPMTIPRAYQATVPLADGSVFALGGSWNGGTGNKHGEVWTAAGGWRRLTGVPVEPMLGADPRGVYRGDNHMWLVPTGNGRVLHAGPSSQMNWIDTRGDGATTPAGTRGDDAYAINGSVVMYEAGKILKTGGAPAYENVDATASTYLIDTTGGEASVRRLAPMAYARAFHNSVVLPNGKVLVVGGQTLPVPFSDNRSVLVPELWDPASETFTPLPPLRVPRNYHSTALLLPDGRVAAIGGGLCGNGCATNHADLEILTPYYLLDASGQPAPRPVINEAAAEAAYGTTTTVATDSPVASFAIVRLSSTTHTVNNDQRRLALSFTDLGDNRYSLEIPSNPGLALPGYYMLFALDAAGVPSVAKMLRIAGEKTPQLSAPGDQTSVAGNATKLQVIASAPGAVTYAATGLPDGLSLDAASGLVSGTPATPGRYRVTLKATNAFGTVSTQLMWTVHPSGTVATRYVKFEALSEVQGRAWNTVAEFNLLDPGGAVIPRDGWRVVADSQETIGEYAPAVNAIDGNATTFWHTQWKGQTPKPPHSLVVDLGAGRPLGGFKYLPRQTIDSGRIANWRLHVSEDGVNWRAVRSGTFVNDALEKTVYPIDTGAADQWPALQSPIHPTVTVGDSVSVRLVATDADGDALSYAVSNLPPGLAVDTATGLISGTPSATGVFASTLLVSDGRGGTATAAMTWTVLARKVAIASVAAAPVAQGTSVTFSPSADAGQGATWAWDFGDGTSRAASSVATASHTYAAPGLYTVTVTVVDASGARTVRQFTQAVYAAPSDSRRATHSSMVAWQVPASGNPRVWVVNADGDSVSAFDAVALTKLGEVAVGNAPRSVAVAPDGRVWVVNKGGASISIVDPSTLSVAQTLVLPRASQPYGIAFAPDGSAAYVTLEASGHLLKLHPASGATLATLAVGPEPRHLSVTPDGAQVLVSRFVTPPQPGEGTAIVATQRDGAFVGGEVLVIDAVNLALERTIVLRHSTRPDSTTQGRGVPNYLGAPVIAPDGRSAWVPSKQDNIQRGMLRDGLNLDFQNTVRAISSRIDLAAFSEDHAARIDHDNAGRAAAAAYHPSGAYLFVALPTSRQVAVVDPARHVEMARIDVGRAPDALLVSADGLRLFVSNFMDRTLQAIDLTPLLCNGEWRFATLATLPTQASEKLSAQALLGKQLFYDARDPRLARDAYMSCASCHDDAGHDGRTWDLTGQGEGLRNTIGLRGRAGLRHGRLHWSSNFDEVQDFEGQIRSLAGGTGLMSDAAFTSGTRSSPLGTPKAGQSSDLDALAAYLRTLDAMPASPERNADGTLTPSAAAGRQVFITQRCASCHAGITFQASGVALADVGTIKPSSGKRLGGLLPGIDVPTLRDVHASGPYLHDGSAATLGEAVLAHRGVSMGAADLANLAAYLRQIGSEAVAAPSALPPEAVRCAAEWSTCALPAGTPATVYYGANGQWVSRPAMTGSVACINEVFGDPLRGTSKACYYVPAVKCSAERQDCSVPAGTTATILYGANGSYYARSGVSGTVACSNSTFGDPLYGAEKACWRQP